MSNHDLPHQHSFHPPSYSRFPPPLHHHHLPNSHPRPDRISARPVDYKLTPLPPHHPPATPDSLSEPFNPLSLSPPRPAPSRPSFRDILNPVDPNDNDLHKQTPLPPQPLYSPPNFPPQPPLAASTTLSFSLPLPPQPLPPTTTLATGISPSLPKPSAPRPIYAESTASSSFSSPSVIHQSFTPWSHPHVSPSMSPTRRSNGYIDLTSPSDNSSQRPPAKRTAPSRPEPSDSGEGTSKRRRTETGIESPVSPVAAISPTSNTAKDALQKPRVEAVKAQQQDGDKVRKLTSLTCVICLDTPKDLTATACGHVFCHECLVNALIAGENRSTRRGEPKRSQCPVCRKAIQRTKAQDVIPLLVKKGLATQPRRPSKVMPI